MLSPSTLARLAPPLFVFLWATGFIAARLVIPYADPLTFLVLRYVLAAGLLALIALAARAPWPAAARGWRDGMVAGMLIHGGYLGAVFWAIKHGLPAGISALIAGLQPLVTGMLVGPLIGERVSPRRWLGIAVGFLGSALVVAPKLGAAGGFSALPVAVCFLGTVSITLGTIWQKRTAAAVDLRTNAVAQFVGAALATLPVALILENGRLEPAPELFIGLTWSVVALSIGAIGLLLVLIRRGAVAGVAALLYLVPPVAALMAYVLFGEALSPVQILGMLVAAAGVAIAKSRLTEWGSTWPPRGFMLHRTAMGASHDRRRRLRCRAGPDLARRRRREGRRGARCRGAPAGAGGSSPTAASRPSASRPSSTRPTASPGSRPMPRRSASWRRYGRAPRRPRAASARPRRSSCAIGFGEYLAQIFGGIPMSQGEIVRPARARPRPAAIAALPHRARSRR